MAFGASAVASALTGALGFLSLGVGDPARGHLTHGASGLTFGYAVDPLSGCFLVVLAIVGGAVAVYSVAYFAHGYGPGRAAFVGVAFNLLLGSVELVLVADGAIGFLFAWELMTLTTAALVATEHERAQSRRAAFLYLVMSHVGTGCLIAGFLLSRLGRSLARASRTCSAPTRRRRRSATSCSSSSCRLRRQGGRHPAAHLAARGAPRGAERISALMSGVIIKTGVYGIVRVCAFGLGRPRPWRGGDCSLLLARRCRWCSACSTR